MANEKQIAIMQPYFLPYIGYWQLIAHTDEFVIYDTIQYTKKGWINRNRFLQNGQDTMFSIPLRKDSDYLHVKGRYLAESFDREKLIRQFEGAYKKAPYFEENFPLIAEIIRCEESNLFAYILNAVQKICAHLEIKTPIIKSSDIDSNHEEEKGQDKVINICQAREASTYINPIGGLDMYDPEIFSQSGLDLRFMKARVLDYTTFKGAPAIAHMSILDVLMFNARASVQHFLNAYDEVKK